MAKTMPRPRHFDRSGAEWRNLTPKCGKPLVAGDLSTLRFIRALSPYHPYRRVSPSRGRKVQRCFVLSVSNGAGGSGTIPCFPLRRNAALAAKGCTRLRVEMKCKGCPDRQTAACLGGVSFETLAVQHPRAASWPSPPRDDAWLDDCHQNKS